MSEPIGCGDSSCVFGTGEGTRWGGQHTNGGCRCFVGPGGGLHTIVRRRLQGWIIQLRKERDEARLPVLCQGCTNPGVHCQGCGEALL